MALPMARPWQHPETGTFYLRQRSPNDVLARAKGQRVTLSMGVHAATVTVGAVVQASLRTKDRDVAKVRHAEADAALKRFWASVRHGPVSLTQKEIVMLAGLAYRATVRVLEDDRSRSLLQVVETAEQAGRHLSGKATFDAARREFVSLLEAQGTPAAWAAFEDPREVPLPLLEAGFGPQADALLAQQGLLVDDASRALLLREVYRAMRDAAGRLERNARGDFRPDPAADRFPAFEPLRPVCAEPKHILTADGLFAVWLDKKNGASSNTRKRYASSFRSLAAFVGDRDIGTLTDDDIYAWAEHRRDADGISVQSINRSDLANVKAVFAWGTTKPAGRIVAHNPATGVRLEADRRQKRREPTFRHGEVVAILRLAWTCEADLRHPKLSAAKRWCPWLAAYSGARISELTDLWGKDIMRDDDIWLMTIDDTKTGSPRRVPMHEHLIALGFLDFVRSSGQGPLFFDGDRKRRGTGTTPAEIASKAIARWIRTETRLDLNVDPNHGWRHTWKTVASGCRVPDREIDAIVGHGPRTVAHRYITPPLKDLAQAMRAFPRYKVEVGD